MSGRIQNILLKNLITEEGNDNYNIAITIYKIQKTEGPNQSRRSGCAIQIEVYDSC